MAEEVTAAVKILNYGTREEVFKGLAKKTKGGLTKEDIVFENNRYKSKKAIAKGRSLVQQLRGVPVPEAEPVEAKPKDLTDSKVVKKPRAPRKPKPSLTAEQEVSSTLPENSC
jgi:hypothetical protein